MKPLYDADCARVAERANALLTLTDAILPDEYYYNSLPPCVIDAVFSVGVRYESVQAVVNRYCRYFKVRQFRIDRSAAPPLKAQESISELCEHFQEYGLERMTREIFANRQRTSTRNGLLKAEAARRFASTLESHRIEYLQDVAQQLPSESLEQDIRSIPGQGSGISLQYFWMLAGSDDLIKPDRMIIRFLETSLERTVQVDEAQSLLTYAASALRSIYPSLTPRLLDFKIWEYQRAQ